MPDSMSDIVDSERCFITIRNGSPPGIRSHCAVAGYVDDLSDDGIPSNSMTNRSPSHSESFWSPSLSIWIVS
jgi:hypothetical protein